MALCLGWASIVKLHMWNSIICKVKFVHQNDLKDFAAHSVAV